MVNLVLVRVLTNTSVRVTWDRILISEITQYLISYQLTGNQKRQATSGFIVVPSTESSVDIAGLITGAEYQFQVTAQAEVGGEIIMGQRSSLTIMSIQHVTDASYTRSSKLTLLGEGLSYIINILHGT